VWLVFGSATEIAFSVMPKVLVLFYSTYGRGELAEQTAKKPFGLVCFNLSI
jgi:hypothetical protein